ncbi:unnamed protein product [Calypogeia fissa]
MLLLLLSCGRLSGRLSLLTGPTEHFGLSILHHLHNSFKLDDQWTEILRKPNDPMATTFGQHGLELQCH